jgi:hypothetical protein
MNFLPTLSSGMIFSAPVDGSEPDVRFEGSCGRYVRPDVVLTAAHCAPPNRSLFLVMPAEGQNTRVVQARAYHPTSDLALLLAPPSSALDAGTVEWLERHTFQLPSQTLIDGGDYVCCGYPAGSSPDSDPGSPDRPTGRTIRGNIQRWFNYTDKDRRSYSALELSTPAPGGLSGSVLAYVEAPQAPVGVVTANFDSYALIDRVEDVEDGSKVYRETTQRVVSYGVAAWLAGKEEWLAEQLAAWPQS